MRSTRLGVKTPLASWKTFCLQWFIKVLASRCYITRASQHTSVINSHHLHYSRLWNNVHQVSSLALCAVLTWADMWHRKSSQIPCHHKSLSSPLCLCLRLPLTVSLTSQPLPTPFHFSPSSLSDFSIFLFWKIFLVYFIFCSVASFTLPPAPSFLWHLPRRSQQDLWKVCFVDDGQLSSDFFVYYMSWKNVPTGHQLVQLFV